MAPVGARRHTQDFGVDRSPPPQSVLQLFHHQHRSSMGGNQTLPCRVVWPTGPLRLVVEAQEADGSHDGQGLEVDGREVQRSTGHENKVFVVVSNLVEDFFDRDRDRLRVDDRAGDVKAEIDEARITLLLKNLVSNALRY